MNRRKWLVFLAVILVVGLLLIKPAPAQSPKATSSELPEVIGMTTLRMGTSSYTLGTALGEVFKEKTRHRIRVTPFDAEKPRLNLLRTGAAYFSTVPGNVLYVSEYGLEDYANYEWGVQPLQMAWIGPLYIGPITTKAHKDINTLADMKGKRVAVVPQRAGNLFAESFLAFAQLSWDDVVKVPVPGYIGQFKALMARKIDVAAFANLTSPILYEVEASPGGIKWLPVTHENKEGWKRLRQVAPWTIPAKATFGPGSSKEKPLEILNIGYAISAYEWTSADLVYLVTKTIGENLPRLQSIAPAWKIHSFEAALDIEGLPHVYHPGAIRYFKEKGLWTPKHEKLHGEQLNVHKRAKDTWKATLDQAKAEKWTPEKLRKQWHERQKAITGYEVRE